MGITFYCFNIVHILFLFFASHRIASHRLDSIFARHPPLPSLLRPPAYSPSSVLVACRIIDVVPVLVQCTCHVLFPGFGKRAIYFSVICHLMDILSCRLQMIHGNGWNSCHLGRNWLKLYCILIEIDMKEIIRGKKHKRTTENVK